MTSKTRSKVGILFPQQQESGGSGRVTFGPESGNGLTELIMDVIQVTLQAI